MEENKTAKKHIEENRIQTYNQRNAKYCFFNPLK